ncbi:MAG: hypothetical protein LAP38_16790 [Acidobacteriia bacterium]|nr:hypothetical protein [Terriglobia bacterium]
MRALGLLLLAGAAFAQDRPQFVWQGEVDGAAILYLRGNRLDVQVKDGTPVARQQFHFYDALTGKRQDARLRVLEGRGYVHVVDQPRIENQYTLAVAIEDRQPGSSFYSIALYWDASSRFFEGSRSQGRMDQVTWSGRVDEEAVVSCRAKTCVSSAARGEPVAAEHFKFSRPLPDRAVDVRLENSEGRGQIRLVEQPSEANHYTARVSIRDPQSGTGEYSFTLRWGRESGKEPEPVLTGPGLMWSGLVEGRVRVTVRGGASVSQVMQGLPIENERAELLRPLPARSDLHPVAKKLQGRGRVEIIEVPSEQNNYQLVFEIDDPEPGAFRYEIELDW